MHAAQAGFTLIEVLVALVILAVGLLGLEALGIHAARSVALAQRQSDYALHATQVMEAAVDTIERSGAGQPGCGSRDFTDRPGRVARRTIEGQAQRRTVTVVISPTSASSTLLPTTPFRLVTHVFVPNAGAC